MTLNVEVEGWTPEALALWLDRQVRQADIHQRELLKWLRNLVDHLLNARGMRISALMRCKFMLARKIQEKINAIRLLERRNVYQSYLFAPESSVSVSFDTASRFRAACTRIKSVTVGAGNSESTFWVQISFQPLTAPMMVRRSSVLR